MTCETVQDALLEIDVQEIPTLSEHLEGCPTCRALADRILDTNQRLARQVDAFAVRPGFDQAFARALVPARPQPMWSPWWSRAAAGLGIAAGLALIPLVLTRDPVPSPVPVPVSVPAAAPTPSMPPPAPPASPPPSEPAPRARPTTGPLESPVAAAPITLPEPSTAEPAELPEDLIEWEVTAILGQLTDGQIAALEAAMHDERQRATQRDRMSRIVMVDAFARGDTDAWLARIRRHVQLWPGDADLHYKLALHLSKLGVEHAEELLLHADLALANASVWSGATLVARTHSLLKIRCVGAQRLWQAAEQARHPSVFAWRELTGAYALEWWDHAAEHGKDTATARDLCVSALGEARCVP